jgi:hypothetical protein
MRRLRTKNCAIGSKSGNKHENKQHNGPKKSKLIVRCCTPIYDPKELYTILLFSIRELWGDLESHSYDMTVEKYNVDQSLSIAKDDQPSALTTLSATAIGTNGPPTYFMVLCRSVSVSAIRASLTMVTTPPYLDDQIYQFDVIQVQHGI